MERALERNYGLRVTDSTLACRCPLLECFDGVTEASSEVGKRAGILRFDQTRLETAQQQEHD